MFDVVGIGANSIDYVYRLPDYPQPDSGAAKLRITSHRVSPGGQTATALCTCAAMGLRTAYLGTVGADDNGRAIVSELQRRTVDTRGALVRDAPNPYAVILLDERHGERIVLWDRHPDVALRPSDIDQSLLGQCRLAHVDDVDIDAAIHAAQLARRVGLPVTSDIEHVTARTGDLIASVTVAIFAESVPRDMTREADPERALRQLRHRYDAMLCVTLGERGALLLDGERLYRAAGVAIDAIDTTGAGDVFRGAFIHGVLHDCAPQETLHVANAAAALSCTRMGAIDAVPTLDDVQRFRARLPLP